MLLRETRILKISLQVFFPSHDVVEEDMSLKKQHQLKVQDLLGKWIVTILLVLCLVNFAVAEKGCPVWGIIEGFKREGLERGKVSFD